MHPVRGKPQQHIPRRHITGQVRTAFHRAHREAREVKITFGIHARHLCCLAPDQRAARAFAAFGDAFDDPRGLFGLKLAGGEII